MIPWYIVKYYVQKHSKFCTVTGVLLLLTVVFYSYIQVFLAAWSFLLGIAVAHSSLSSDTVLPNLLFMFGRKKKARNSGDDELTLMKTVCTVCGQRKCPRHRPELNILAFQPWNYLEVRKGIDEAVEEFANIVLKEFLYTWYKDLTADEEFADELKQGTRFLASVLLRRAKKIDIPKLVSEKLIVAALYHLHNYLDAKRHVPAGSDLQQTVLERLGPNMHVALQSRKAEVEYLRRMVESLFPYILPPQALNSKCACALIREISSGSVLLPALDAIANPDMVNNLILVFLDDTPPPPATVPPGPYVPFLENFARPLANNKSCFHLTIKEVLSRDNPVYLYPFMQFLKNEAAINVLQFNLACEDFNTRILSPELSQGELVELHNMAKDLFRTYCSPSAQDRIKFDEKTVEELQEIVEGPPDQVIRLRTSTPLFKAYDHTYNLLENTFLPLFHQSDPFYTLLCGSREPSQIFKSQSSNYLVPKSIFYNPRQPEKRSFGFSNIGTKIKGVFKSGDGRSLPEGENFEDADRVTIASCSSLDDEISETLELELPDFTVDLSTWRVCIPRVGARPEPDNIKKQFLVFIIDVRRASMNSGGENNDFSGREHWTVARRYNEFYVLESKLAEFHGDLLQDCQLPPKKLVGTGKQEFIEGKKELFEQYLQKLLTKPFLKGSQLLFNFLTSENQFTASFLPDINLGKMFKSGAMKLVKEKGKHLESFLQTYEQSTIAPPPRSSKSERRGSDASMKSTSSEKLCAGLYENNANYSTDSVSSSVSNGEYGSPSHQHQNQQGEVQEIDGAYDILVYIARYAYSVPDWFHHLLMTGRILVKSTLENYLEYYIEQKIDQVTQEHRVVRLVHLLRDVLFFDTDPPRTDEEKRERFEKTLQGALDYIPKPFVSVVGRTNHENGTKLILEVLQQPKLNKQLSYVFLDIFVQEMFPELKG